MKILFQKNKTKYNENISVSYCQNCFKPKCQ